MAVVEKTTQQLNVVECCHVLEDGAEELSGLPARHNRKPHVLQTEQMQRDGKRLTKGGTLSEDLGTHKK